MTSRFLIRLYIRCLLLVVGIYLNLIRFHSAKIIGISQAVFHFSAWSLRGPTPGHWTLSESLVDGGLNFDFPQNSGQHRAGYQEQTLSPPCWVLANQIVKHWSLEVKVSSSQDTWPGLRETLPDICGRTRAGRLTIIRLASILAPPSRVPGRAESPLPCLQIIAD